MLNELETQFLHVELIPQAACYGTQRRKLRVVTSQNPAWYRDLCAAHPKNRGRCGGPQRQRRKPDTLIKRDHVYRGLLQLLSGRNTIYTERLLPYVLRYENGEYL